MRRSVRHGRRERGISLIEVMLASMIVTIPLLGYAAQAVRSQKSTSAAAERATALLTLERFVERMRADSDYTGLHGRLAALSAENPSDAALTRLCVEPSLTAYPATSYYSDFETPERLQDARVLVQVPSTTVSGTAALRESATAPRYGLPADLNGDGVVDANSRNADYVVLPVVVRLRWKHAGSDAQEVVLATWLRSAE